ncbi:hypothetical protein ACFOGI_03065 [Virgibacillus xinjiangensis]|uniref:ABC-2 type transport system permease protein n=1 Tax=Virgibacillus xinjiangensis TaxID=393090 RepID=A0ABV7CSX1_9BACI
MKKQTQGLLYFFMADVRHSLMVFWTILLGILVISLAFAWFLTRVDDGFMSFSLTGPIYIYCAILGFLTVKESVPFAIRMGATRKSLFVSIGLFFLGLSLIMGLAANILHELVLWLTEGVGLETFSFLHAAYFLEDTFFTRVLIDSSIMLLLLSGMFLLGLLFFRFGLAGGGASVGVLFLVVLIGVADGWLIDSVVDIFTGLEAVFFYQLLGIGCTLYLISYLLLRRITIVNAK